MPKRNKRSKMRKRFRELQEQFPKRIDFTDCNGGVTFIKAEHHDDEDVQAEPPTFKMLAYTGDVIRQPQFKDPIIIDLKGMSVPRQERPVLLNHKRDQIVGHSTKIALSATQIDVEGIISGTGDSAREVLETAANGFPWQSSIGAKIERIIRLSAGRKMHINSRTVEGPLMVVTKSRLDENSFVPLGADDNTSASISAVNQDSTLGADEMTFSEWLEAGGFDATSLSDSQTVILQSAYDADNVEAEAETDEDAIKAAAETAKIEAAAEAAKVEAARIAAEAEVDTGDVTTTPDVTTTIRAEAAAEVRRLAALAKSCSDNPEIHAKAIEGNWSAEKVELEMFRAEMPTAPAVHMGKTLDSGTAIEAALCMRAGLKEDDLAKDYGSAVMEVARKERNITLQEVCNEVIRATGQSPGRGFGDDNIRAAMMADRYQIQAAGFSTVSLPGILGNVANKALLAAYQAVPSIVKNFCSETSAKDFKQTSSYRMTATGSFQPLGPNGELKHGSLDEDTYNNQVLTQGKIVALSRTMLINDDLGAFLQIPRGLGRGAAVALEKSVFELLIANTGTFFSSGNGNLNTTNALTVPKLEVAQTAFRVQTDANSDLVMVEPTIILTPTALSVTAKQIFQDTELAVTGISGTVTKTMKSNPFKGSFVPYSSPYLDTLTNGSATTWYLFASPSDVPAMEIVYLQGKRSPTIERGDMDFNQLGIQYRSFFDWGVAFQDYRGASKNTA